MWSKDVYVSGARITNGDDCITVKSGSRDVLVEDLYCEHGDGLTIGSVWYDDVTNVTYRRVLMNRTHNGPMIKGRSQGNATVRDILFEDVKLVEVYLGLTIDCDYETHGTVVPNIGVLATNVTFRNVSGTVVAGRPRARGDGHQIGLSSGRDQHQARNFARGDPSFLVSGAIHCPLLTTTPYHTFLVTGHYTQICDRIRNSCEQVDSAGTFICRESRPCDFSLSGVHITHASADASNVTEPQWLCNNSLLDAHPTAVSPSLPTGCLHRK
jgi:hypothetical protein